MYGIEKPLPFKTKEQYIGYLKESGDFDMNQVLYLDSSSYYKMGSEILPSDSSVAFLGCFLNDSISIRKSPFLIENQSCYGRMLQDIESAMEQEHYDDSILNKNIQIGKFNLYPLMGGKKFNCSGNPEKLKIILLYGFFFGKYYKRFYREIAEIQRKNSVKADLYIFSMDPVCYLQ
jgi:hypothetical protein